MSFFVGITPDFYSDASGHFESALENLLAPAGIAWEAMPPLAGNVATPEVLDRYDAVLALATRMPAESFTGLSRLVLVSRWGVGYDHIDTVALTQADVALAITPNAVRRPVAEAILTFIFALTTNLMLQDRTVREGKWRGSLDRLGRNIRGRTLGSLGLGNIARELFSMVQSLGFGKLIACDPFVEPAVAKALGVELVSQEQLFSESDFLCVNAFLSSKTRGLVDETHLRMMKPTSYLINTARGPVVDQPALTRALEQGWIAGAGLDVFEQEPLPADDPIRRAPNTIFAPHALAWTEEIARGNSVEACENILAAARGELPQSIVNRDVCSREGFQTRLARFRPAGA